MRGITAIIAVLIIGIVGLTAYSNYGTIETIDAVVTKTERITTKEDSKYLVFTEDETFENTDEVWHLKFNSSDVQGQLKEGQKYAITVNGWRVPVLSMYRNIISVEESE